MMVQKSYADNRGMALLITLAVITVVVTAALEINRQARSDAVAAAVLRDRFTLSQMAASGVHLAMALLVKDRRDTIADSVQESWAQAEVLGNYMADFPFEAGEVAVAIEDERSKIQVNALVVYPEGRQVSPAQYRIWTRIARHLAATAELPEEVDPVTIVHSLADWLDRGDDDAVTGLSGAESDYYQSLVPPYSCRNGPIACLDELTLVQGVTPELLEAAGGIDGISRYLTVHGLSSSGAGGATYDGRININTADLPVLAAILPDTHAPFAQAIASYREEASGDVYLHSLLDPDWYRQVIGAGNLSIDPVLITVASDVFRIIASAGLHNRLVTITAVVRREKDEETGRWQCRVLQWTEE